MLFTWMLQTTFDHPHRKTKPELSRPICLQFTFNIKVTLFYFLSAIARSHNKGHSMTIIGFEIRDNGSANLLVFDPMFKTSPAMERLIGAFVKLPDPTRLLKAYRRGTPYLQKYKIFELLK
jgi:hypothetical protein